MKKRIGLALCLWLLSAGEAIAQTNVKVVAGEYFIDTDPGIGSGTAYTLPMPLDSVNVALNITTPTTLKPGQHFAYTRTRVDSAGFYNRWSVAEAQAFYVKNKVLRAEYFFDNDPGPGAGISLAINTPADSINQNTSITAPANLPDGHHKLYVRSQSADGAWGLAESRDFFINPTLATAEYFFDNDPGIGAGAALSIGLATDTFNVLRLISVVGLSGGSHRLYVRSKSAGGVWSLAGAKDFFILPKIIAAEYFWDIDPGAGSGNQLTVAALSDSVAASYTIHTPCLGPGIHYLYMRTKDEQGAWALPATDSIQFAQPTMVVTAINPGAGPYGTPVKISASGGSAPYHYAYLPTAPVMDSIFLAPNNTLVTFVAMDTCGYTDTTTIMTPAAPTAIAANATGSGTKNFIGWRHWVYITDGSGAIISALKDGGQNLGNVTVSYLKNSGATRTFPSNGVPYLNRNFLVQTGAAPAAPVGVQLFALNTEYNALAAADPSVTAKSTLYLTKYDGPNQDLNCNNNAAGGQLFPSDSVVGFSSVSGNGYALAFSVNSFSEFYESRNYVNPLPLQNIALSAVAVNGKVQLDWHTNNEQNLSTHTVLRLNSDGAWDELAIVGAKNGIINSYAYTDVKPKNGANFYKIKSISLAGETGYSPLATAIINDRGGIIIYPNPVRGYMHLRGLALTDIVALTDVTGHEVLRMRAAGVSLDINAETLAAGSYTLSVRDEQGIIKSAQQVEILP